MQEITVKVPDKVYNQLETIKAGVKDMENGEAIELLPSIGIAYIVDLMIHDQSLAMAVMNYTISKYEGGFQNG